MALTFHKMHGLGNDFILLDVLSLDRRVTLKLNAWTIKVNVTQRGGYPAPVLGSGDGLNRFPACEVAVISLSSPDL